MEAGSSKERGSSLDLAKLAEQGERYDEMVEAMKNVLVLDVKLTVEERNLLLVGYRNVIGQRRTSWRILSSIEQNEESRGNEQNLKRNKEYGRKIETEVVNICGDVVRVIDKHFILSCGSGESTMYFYQMVAIISNWLSLKLMMTEKRLLINP